MFSTKDRYPLHYLLLKNYKLYTYLILAVLDLHAECALIG